MSQPELYTNLKKYISAFPSSLLFNSVNSLKTVLINGIDKDNL